MTFCRLHRSVMLCDARGELSARNIASLLLRKRWPACCQQPTSSHTRVQQAGFIDPIRTSSAKTLHTVIPDGLPKPKTINSNVDQSSLCGAASQFHSVVGQFHSIWPAPGRFQCHLPQSIRNAPRIGHAHQDKSARPDHFSMKSDDAPAVTSSKMLHHAQRRRHVKHAGKITHVSQKVSLLEHHWKSQSIKSIACPLQCPDAVIDQCNLSTLHRHQRRKVRPSTTQFNRPQSSQPAKCRLHRKQSTAPPWTSPFTLQDRPIFVSRRLLTPNSIPNSNMLLEAGLPAFVHAGNRSHVNSPPGPGMHQGGRRTSADSNVVRSHPRSARLCH